MTTFVRRVRVAVASCAVAFAVAASARAAEPAPSAAELNEAVELLKEVFEKDYKAAESETEAKKALARKLFDGAPKRKATVLRYASLDEARRLAASAGDAKLALDALTALTSQFTGTPPELAGDTLKLFGGADLSPAAATEVILLATDGANAALEREDYAGAVSFGKLRVTAAKKSEDPDKLLDAKKSLDNLEALETAVNTAKTKPDDAEANAVLGRYWALTGGRWDVGLKFLAKGAYKELAAAAKLDLAKPTTAKARTAAADAWYKLANDTDAFTADERRRLIGRAWEWYSAALAVATADDDLKPSARIKEIEKAHPHLFDQTLTGHTGAAAAVAVTPDGKTLVSVGNDNAVRLWDAATGKLLATLEGHTAWVGSVVVTPDGARAVTAGGDNVIRVWELATRKEVKKLEGHTVAIRGLALTPDGKTLVSGASDKTCRAWDLATGKELKRYGDGKQSVESVAVTPDGKRVLAGSDVGVVTVYDAATGDVVSKFDKHGGTMVYTIVTTADGKTAVSAARDKDIRVWDVATGKEVRVLAGHSEQVYQLALSRDAKYLASVSYDKTVRVWDFATGRELKKFEGHTDGVQGVCFTPDGRFVFSASWDKTIRKWRLPAFAPGKKKLD